MDDAAVSAREEHDERADEREEGEEQDADLDVAGEVGDQQHRGEDGGDDETHHDLREQVDGGPATTLDRLEPLGDQDQVLVGNDGDGLATLVVRLVRGSRGGGLRGEDAVLGPLDRDLKRDLVGRIGRIGGRFRLLARGVRRAELGLGRGRRVTLVVDRRRGVRRLGGAFLRSAEGHVDGHFGGSLHEVPISEGGPFGFRHVMRRIEKKQRNSYPFFQSEHINPCGCLPITSSCTYVDIKERPGFISKNGQKVKISTLLSPILILVRLSFR